MLPSRLIPALAALLLLGACSPSPVRVVEPVSAVAPQANDNLNATLWMQNSAEYAATVRGVYAAAARSLDAALADPSWNALPHGEYSAGYESRAPAIIVDIDETFIDNSRFQARGVIDGIDYTPQRWLDWVRSERAEAMPGAVEFASYVASRGVVIYYVTNRDAPGEVAATVSVLRKLGFPVARDGSNVMLRGDLRAPDRDKGERRRLVERDHRVLLVLGDNLGDFLDGTDADIGTREALMAPYESWWGERWFMLPNPTYGSWPAAIQRGCPPELGQRACLQRALKHDY